MPTASLNSFGFLSSINDIGRQFELEILGQDISTITALENVMCEAGAESSKSTDSALEGGSKAKKTRERKPRSKSAGISESSIIQNQLTPESSEDLNISKEDLHMYYEKEARRDEKIKAEIRCKLAI
ncbi:23054_t:CDS:1 [Dentiscutata erythropus]|uniref:23054_t:CDS:1 n=1 Tax=Dentiscutata erythropus TaxID=1348616 RepID=A0A9N9DDK4_9GLOM|nr:23054_t:CDS:1 [Dentiscutata erythropus]